MARIAEPRQSGSQLPCDSEGASTHTTRRDRLAASGMRYSHVFSTAARLLNEELHELQSDPFEIHSLAASTQPQHRKALREMRAVLSGWIEETNDQGRILEPPELIDAFTREMEQWFGTPDWYRKGEHYGERSRREGRIRNG